ncbi:hypothetical protein [Arsenophonus sp.]|uniref:hypothetical protein n=1 Tax=Arsenophonus sp. TaxID=1872640 RepID=UPI00387922BE
MSKSISILALLACYLCSGAVSAVKLFLHDGNSALTKEQAREQSEQWNAQIDVTKDEVVGHCQNDKFKIVYTRLLHQ